MTIALTTILICMNTLMTLMATTSSQKATTATIMQMHMGLGITSMGTRHLVTMPNWMTTMMTCGNRNRSITSFSLLSVLQRMEYPAFVTLAGLEYVY